MSSTNTSPAPSSILKANSPIRTAAVAVALLSLAAFPACKKDGAESGGGGSSQAASAALDYMPKGATIVFGLNMQSLVNAKVLEKYRGELMKKAPPEMTELQTACGMDFMKDIKSVTGGMIGENQGIIVVTGNFNQAKVEECVTKAAEKEGKKIEMSDDGKIRVYKGGGSDSDVMYAHFPKDGTVVINPSDLGGPALLKGVLAGEKLSGGDVMNLIKSTKTGATMWAAGDPKSFPGSVPGGQDMTGFAGTINAGDNLDVKVLVNFSSEEKAKATEAQAQGGLAMAKGHPMAAPFKEIIEKFKLEADGKAIKAGVSLTGGDIDKIANAAKQFGAF